VELLQLLIDFATAYKAGRTLAPDQMTELEKGVRDVVWKEWQHRGAREEIPIGRKTVVWMKRSYAKTKYAPELVIDIENKFDSNKEILNATIVQLNRLLTRGPKAPPRLVQQVLKRLERGEKSFDASTLIADTFKYAVREAIRNLQRRKPKPKTRPNTKPRPTVLPDRLVLLRSEAALAKAASERPRELAFCVVRDYSRGGVPRAKCAPFGQLEIGSATVVEVLSKIDAKMDAFSAANQGTRCKDPRLTGIGDKELSRILSDVDEPVAASSIPTLATRYRKRCEDALGTGDEP